MESEIIPHWHCRSGVWRFCLTMEGVGMSLVECRTAAEVMDNYRAVKERARQRERVFTRPEVVQPKAVAKPEKKPVAISKPYDLKTIVSILLDHSEVDAEFIHIGGKARPTMSAIKAIVCKKYEITEAELTGSSRRKVFVRPRFVAIYLCCKHTMRSMPEVGRRFGDRDHTTVLNARDRITLLRITDVALHETLLELERALGVA